VEIGHKDTPYINAEYGNTAVGELYIPKTASMISKSM
jgi:hypothetical protein